MSPKKSPSADKREINHITVIIKEDSVITILTTERRKVLICVESHKGIKCFQCSKKNKNFKKDQQRLKTATIIQNM